MASETQRKVYFISGRSVNTEMQWGSLSKEIAKSTNEAIFRRFGLQYKYPLYIR